MNLPKDATQCLATCLISQATMARKDETVHSAPNGSKILSLVTSLETPRDTGHNRILLVCTAMEAAYTSLDIDRKQNVRFSYDLRVLTKINKPLDGWKEISRCESSVFRNYLKTL